MQYFFEFLQEKGAGLITDTANLSYLNEVILPFSTSRQFTYKNLLTTALFRPCSALSLGGMDLC
ncbi:hypothetical protein CS542_09885 [Pedobacter sp. IW39]|nr:hypothetical protein CS542_09885 [Pedobacter sp. IW39]